MSAKSMTSKEADECVLCCWTLNYHVAIGNSDQKGLINKSLHCPKRCNVDAVLMPRDDLV